MSPDMPITDRSSSTAPHTRPGLRTAPTTESTATTLRPSSDDYMSTYRSDGLRDVDGDNSAANEEAVAVAVEEDDNGDGEQTEVEDGGLTSYHSYYHSSSSSSNNNNRDPDPGDEDEDEDYHLDHTIDESQRPLLVGAAAQDHEDGDDQPGPPAARRVMPMATLDKDPEVMPSGGSGGGEALQEGFVHHAEAVWDGEMSYGPRGFRGLFASRYVAICAAFGAVGGFSFGFDQGVISVILVMPQFLDRFRQVAEPSAGSGFWKGLMTAMLELGALLGALNNGWVSDRFSRKYAMVTGVVVFIAGAILQTAAIDYAMLTIGRLIGGFGIGMLSAVVPLWISEISPPEIRGSLLVLQEFAIVIGIVVAFWTTYTTRYIAGEWSWRLPFLLQMVPGIILGIGVLFLPFSPRWLVAQGRDDEALTTLGRLRMVSSHDTRVMQEWFNIRAEVAFHREVELERHPNLQDGTTMSMIKLEIAGWTDCFKRGCWRRTHVGMVVMGFQQFVGINALIYYSPSLFETMGLAYDMQLIMSGVLNITQLLGVVTSLYTMDRLGRRPLLLIGSGLMCISHLIIAILVGLYSDNWPAHRTQGWVSVAMLLLFVLEFGASWGPVPWCLPSEIFPSSLRAKGVALSTASTWLNNFIIGVITPPLVQDTGYGAYAFFAVSCLLASVWTFVYVPETAGRTLEQMDMVFKDISGEHDEARRSAIESQIISASAQQREHRDWQHQGGVRQRHS